MCVCSNTTTTTHREGGIEVQPGEPHAYEVADKCYRDMVRDRRSQSILISGESGAGEEARP